MLELALLFLSFSRLAAPLPRFCTRPRPVRLFCLGLACGFAVLMLHVSMGASLIFLTGLAVTIPERRKGLVITVLLGMAVPLLPGASYIGLHWRESSSNSALSFPENQVGIRWPCIS